MIRPADMRIAHLKWQIGIFRGYEWTPILGGKLTSSIQQGGLCRRVVGYDAQYHARFKGFERCDIALLKPAPAE